MYPFAYQHGNPVFILSSKLSNQLSSTNTGNIVKTWFVMFSKWTVPGCFYVTGSNWGQTRYKHRWKGSWWSERPTRTGSICHLVDREMLFFLFQSQATQHKSLLQLKNFTNRVYKNMLFHSENKCTDWKVFIKILCLFKDLEKPFGTVFMGTSILPLSGNIRRLGKIEPVTLLS